MIRIINSFLSKFGYEVVSNKGELPSSKLLFSNFINLFSAYEIFFEESESVTLDKNSLRTTLFSRLRGTPPSEAFFLAMGLAKSKNIAGDVCEFGVAQGETSALIANEISEGEKILHLFDSFQGLSEPTSEDELKDDIFGFGKMDAYKGSMSYQKNWVISRLQKIGFSRERYQIHEGFIEDVIAANVKLPQKISFAYVDFDLYAPIKATLEFLHTRTPYGAIIIIDDYDFFSTGVKRAVTEFLEKYPGYQIKIPEHVFGHFAILTKN